MKPHSHANSGTSTTGSEGDTRAESATVSSIDIDLTPLLDGGPPPELDAAPATETGVTLDDAAATQTAASDTAATQTAASDTAATQTAASDTAATQTAASETATLDAQATLSDTTAMTDAGTQPTDASVGGGELASDASAAQDASDAAEPSDGGTGVDASLVWDPRCSQIAADATMTAHLKITADNECDVYVNGSSVGTTNNWGAAVTLDVSLFVHPGRMNVVAVEARNVSSQNGNDRGLIGELTTTLDGGGTETVLVTDQQWRVSQTPGTDWIGLSYDDSNWPSATEVASTGDAPWGNVLDSQAAKWIWFAPIPVYTSDKPNLETTYARRVFYLDFDGQVSNAPACATPVAN